MATKTSYSCGNKYKTTKKKDGTSKTKKIPMTSAQKANYQKRLKRG